MREFSLLKTIYAKNAGLGQRVLIPPGDDMSLLLLDGNRILAAVDQVIAGKHFDATTTPVQLIGHKAVARSASDIAAMAGVPRASLASAVVPAQFGDERANLLFESVRRTAEELRCPLIGGDTVIADAPLMLSITVLAEPGPLGAIRRDTAKAGDHVYVTGQLGGAWRDQEGGRHLTFTPRIMEALRLAELIPISAMLDISDGLGRDLDHIAEQSGLAAMIEAESVPCSDGCTWLEAVSEGEDYELCFCVGPAVKVPTEVLGIPVTRIGSVQRFDGVGPRTTVILSDGRRLDATGMGWEHSGR